MEINPSPCADQVQKVCFPLPTATYTAHSAMAALRQLQPSRVRHSGRPLTVIQIELEQLFSAKRLRSGCWTRRRV